MGTLREKELGHAHQLPALLADLQREHVLCLQPLQPLTDAQIGTLVSSVSSVPTVQRITDRAAGNPFFAEELARALSETLQDDSSRLQRGQGRGGESSEEIALPESIAAALDLRLSRLTAACCSLLSKASVLGRSFSFQVIEAMEAATPGSQDEVVLGVLEEALLSGLLMEEGTGANITYQFWHPLLSSHLYEKLSAARRASLHRRAAAILEQTHQGHEEEEAATITHHLVLGGAASSRIALWAERAAWKDYALSAHYQATRHFRLAIEHLSTTADSSTEQSDARLHRALLLESVRIRQVRETTELEAKACACWLKA